MGWLRYWEIMSIGNRIGVLRGKTFGGLVLGAFGHCGVRITWESMK